MLTLMESLAVVTSGPELMAGSSPMRRNRNGKNSPSVVDTIIDENIASVNATAKRTFWAIFSAGPLC